MDTVNANKRKEKWSGNPFKPYVTKNYIEGRGAVDMNGGTAAAICSLYILEKKDVPGGDIGEYSEDLLKDMIGIKSLSGREGVMAQYLYEALERAGMEVNRDNNGNVIGKMSLKHYNGNIIFVGTVREEAASDKDREKGLPYVLEHSLQECDIELPTAAVMTEPTNMYAAIRHPGRVVAHITFRGRKGGPCHTGDMKKGDNAAINSFPYLTKLAEAFDGIININQISSDSKDENKVPSEVIYSIDKRFYRDLDEVVRTIEELKVNGKQPTIDYIGRRKPFEGNPNSDIAKAFAFRMCDGSFLSMDYSTDATYTDNNDPIIPSLVIGVGDPKLAHQQHERAIREDLRAAPVIYAQGFGNYFKN